MEKLATIGWENVEGSSEYDPCKCGTWEDHWKNFSGKTWPLVCSKSDCHSAPEVGAHVRNDRYENEEFIIPLCKRCNKYTKKFAVRPTTCFVPADPKKTCER